jgi:hypothetical protein
MSDHKEISPQKHHVSINDHQEILDDLDANGESGSVREEEVRSSGVPHDDVPTDAPLCSACHKTGSTYETFPCRCNKFCKKCAMKMATGGKCKTCHQLFASVTHINKN